MKHISRALVRTGVVPKDALKELQRWGLPVDELLDQAAARDLSPEQVVDIIRDALDNSDNYALRDTDLDIMQLWLSGEGKQQGKLHLVVDGKKSVLTVTFVRTRMGEYAIPWRSESITEVLLESETFLVVGQKKVSLLGVRELFFGDQKVFVVCQGEEQ